MMMTEKATRWQPCALPVQASKENNEPSPPHLSISMPITASNSGWNWYTGIGNIANLESVGRRCLQSKKKTRGQEVTGKKLHPEFAGTDAEARKEKGTRARDRVLILKRYNLALMHAWRKGRDLVSFMLRKSG